MKNEADWAAVRLNRTQPLMKSSLRGFVHLALAFAVLMLNLSVVRRAKGASFLTNSPLITARAFHTTTLLPSGKMLVAGGYNDNSGAISCAETYDPSTGVWMTTGALNTARYHHTATLLPNGKVLVTGGTGSNGILSSSELYDPVTGIWTITGALNTGRDLHTATLLFNGQLLVSGGEASTGQILSSAEIYNPATGLWLATTEPLNIARYDCRQDHEDGKGDDPPAVESPAL